MLMKIKILGNGGAINNGLPYNAFMIDDKALIECPPDIMLSLQREKIDINSIEEIYISHLHGDHCFGFPFLALAFFYEIMRTGQTKKIKLFAPAGSRERLIDLSGKALSADNPTINWIKNNIEFVTISNQSEIKLLTYETKIYLMEHSQKNYGFILNDGKKKLLAYISDTTWCHNVEVMLSESPKIILIDLNGEADDPVPIHLSEEEIIEKGIKLVNPGTIFYGTHLKYQKESTHKNIKYVIPGMEIDI
jgi:ribonuclease BN (tRNA processing enzyme)